MSSDPVHDDLDQALPREARLQRLEFGNARLRQELRRYQRFFAICADLVFTHTIDADGTCGPFESVNDEACHRLGYPREELLRMTTQDIIVEDDVADELPVASELCQRGELVFERTLRARDGTLIPVEFRSRTYHEDGQRRVVSVARDLTDRHHAWNAVQALVDAAQDSALLLSPDGIIMAANEVLARRFGFNHKDQIVGLRAAELVSPEVMAGRQRYIDQVLATGRPVVFTDERDGNLYRHTIQAVRSPSGEFTALAIFGRDMTQEAALEAQACQARTMDAVGKLASGIAHDFRNVLHAMTGNLELARQHLANGEDATALLESSQEACRQAEALVRRILAVGRQQPEEREPVSLQQVAADVIDLLQGSHPDHVYLSLQADAGCPPVPADPVEMFQVVLNLCTNALRAVEDEGGQVRISVASVAPQGEAPGGGATLVELAVHDDGHGMSEATRQRCFEPYYGTHSSDGGSGMGLAIVHGIVTALGGTAEIDSAPGKGTTVVLRLPTSSDLTHQGSQTAPREQTPPPSSDGAIMLVDDEVDILIIERIALERAGYQVRAYQSAHEALAAFVDAPEAVSAVVTDRSMPDMDGLELVAALQSTRPGLPCILCTGLSGEDDEALQACQCLHAVLPKPVELSAFVATVDGALERSGEA